MDRAAPDLESLLCALCAADPRTRREALGEVDVYVPAVRLALRNLVLGDPDAGLRAMAAARLGACRDGAVAAVLREALRDGAPAVREAACRALGRLGDGLAAARLLQLLREDEVWWVRRSAGLALAVVQGEAAVPALHEALLDPFWRVRHAALQALFAMGGDAALRRRILLPAQEAATPAVVRRGLAFLRARWEGAGEGAVAGGAGDEPAVLAGGAGDEPAVLAGGAQRPAFASEDPAVTTARLLALPATASLAVLHPRDLVPLLADAHQALREEAARRLAAGIAAADEHELSEEGEAADRSGFAADCSAGSMADTAPAAAASQAEVRAQAYRAALRAALPLLDTPSLPHAAATVAQLLDRLGGPARELATEVLRAPKSRVGAVAWACGYVAAIGDEELSPLVRARIGDPAVRIRRAAVAALGQLHPPDVTGLRQALADPDGDVREAAAMHLLRLGMRSQKGPARGALFALPFAAQGVPVRCGLVALAHHDRDGARLREALGDAHPLVRSQALRALRDLGEALPDLPWHEDPDPWLREAALDLRSAPAALRGDDDVHVRRGALRLLVSPAGRASLPAAEAQALGLLCSTAADPWLRAQGARLFSPASREGLRALLRLLRDPDPQVRAAVAPLLEAGGDALRPALRDLLTPGSGADAQEQAAAQALLLRAWDEAALDDLAQALAGDAHPLVAAQLGAMAAAFPAALLDQAPQAVRAAAAGVELALQPPPRTRVPVVPPIPPCGQRPLGRTGLLVSPLGISGANDLSPTALGLARDAGVNLFFWEPRYAELTVFLRRQRHGRHSLVLVAGTYHGDAAGIERDVHSALRRLRTDHLDVFLLFWVRAPERLDEATHRCLAGLRQAGKIRALGFSTHHRELARQAIVPDGADLGAGAHIPTGTAALAAPSPPWDVIMTRHSAAHPGAEDALFPAAQAAGVGILTFSALCYGRLLRPLAGAPEAGPLPSAADCYRYSLSQAGVSACLSAPRTRRELWHNLGVLSAPTLEPAAEARLRVHGAQVRAEDRRFNTLVRQPASGAGALLLELLEAPLPPELPD